MSSGNGLSEFPDVKAKLQKPTKQSAFEKQRAEAEAKRLREAAETAAVYDDFVKSFDHDDTDDRDARTGAPPGGFGAPRGRFGGAVPLPTPGVSKRHFGSSALKSGPGSLGPPPSSFGKKRSFQDFARGPRDRAMLGFEDDEASRVSVPKAFDASDDEDMGGVVDPAEEKAMARPTLRLSNLPPGTSPSMIKALMPENLVVEQVKILPPAPAAGTERKCAVAIVTLSTETPANDIDGAVSGLQNRYLGYGYYLSLHRHLSSAVSSTAALPNLGNSSAGSHPFGAKPVEQPSAPSSNAGQNKFHRGFAPPTSYNQSPGGVNRANLLHVPVKPPQDIRMIQIINKVIEGVLQHGAEYEGLLMSRPEVQREEKWAWIWDARSEGGIWYRWRLWEIVTGSQGAGTKGKYVPVFDGGHAWKAPEKGLVYEYTTEMDEFVSDEEYNSVDDEESDGEGARENQGDEKEKPFLNPFEKARLTHLLARLPTTLSKLRKGDIARVTAFAITHASRGVDEVVDMIVSNIERPFSLTAANPHKQDQQGTGADEASNEGQDVSAGCLVGLYVVSDILSSSSTSGVRHAWRFRQIFEMALKDRGVFESLGSMAEKLGWGRMRAEKWKRSINLVLHLWEGWCVFQAHNQELFTKSFNNPPSLKAVDKAEGEVKSGRWKVVDAAPAEGESEGAEAGPIGEDVVGEPIEEDVEGEPIEEDDVEGEPIEDDDVEGEPIEDDDVEGEPMDEDEPRGGVETMENKEAERNDKEERAGPPRAQPRKRMRAVDMFADSDGSDGN